MEVTRFHISWRELGEEFVLRHNFAYRNTKTL